MDTLENLYTLALSAETSWKEKEAVDWSEAEEIARACADIPTSLRFRLPRLAAISEYADEHEDWDCCEVGGWPSAIVREIEDFEPSYHYREDGDNWEVFAMALTGEEEWKGTVETQALAKKLVSVLGGNMASGSPIATAELVEAVETMEAVEALEGTGLGVYVIPGGFVVADPLDGPHGFAIAGADLPGLVTEAKDYFSEP